MFDSDAFVTSTLTVLFRYTVTCHLTVVVGLLSHVTQMLTEQTGCSLAAAGGTTSQLLMAA